MRKLAGHTVTNLDPSTSSRFGVLGDPIAHSKSPIIHAAAYEVLGLDWSYDKHQCAERELEPFLRSRDASWQGFSLTMPLKEEAKGIAEVVDPIAHLSGGVNTLRRTGTGWHGWNTDVDGLARVILDSDAAPAHAIVLGTGATAASAVLAAYSAGFERVSVWGRRPEAVVSLVKKFHGVQIEDLGVSPWGVSTASSTGPLQLNPVHGESWAESDTSLIISTLPGPAGHDLKLQSVLTAIPLIDVAYHPWPSPLAQRWTSAGGTAHSGLAMLVNQALLQIRIFYSGDVIVPLQNEPRVIDAMYRALDVRR